MIDKVRGAEVLVFVTPIYYYELSGQLKTFLDRCNPLFPQEYAFRDAYLLSASAEDGDEVWRTAANGLQGWIACFPERRFAGNSWPLTPLGKIAGMTKAELQALLVAGNVTATLSLVAKTSGRESTVGEFDFE